MSFKPGMEENGLQQLSQAEQRIRPLRQQELRLKAVVDNLRLQHAEISGLNKENIKGFITLDGCSACSNLPLA